MPVIQRLRCRSRVRRRCKARQAKTERVAAIIPTTTNTPATFPPSLRNDDFVLVPLNAVGVGFAMTLVTVKEDPSAREVVLKTVTTAGVDSEILPFDGSMTVIGTGEEKVDSGRSVTVVVSLDNGAFSVTTDVIFDTETVGTEASWEMVTL